MADTGGGGGFGAAAGGGAGPGALVSGQKTVTTAGTAVTMLAATARTKHWIVKALDTNTDVVAIGNVSNDVTVSNGLRLSPGEGVSFDHDYGKTAIYLDSAVNGEGVSFIYIGQ